MLYVKDGRGHGDVTFVMLKAEQFDLILKPVKLPSTSY